MSLTITQIAEAFSAHEFKKTYPYLLDTIQWDLVGNECINGKENVIHSCQQSADYLAKVTTRFSKFSIIANETHVVIDSVAEYVDDQQKSTKIASCDLCEFIDRKLSALRSYSVDIS